MLKKILLFALASLMLLACAKVSEPTEKLVTVTFDYRLVEENSMYATKAMTNEEVVFDIQQCLPSSISLVLQGTGTTSGVYTVKSGEATQVPAGTYNVTGTSFGAQIGDLINTNCYFTDKPYITINTSVTIVEGTSQYSVAARFNSFCIVVDFDEITKATYKNNLTATKEITFNRYDNVGLIFCQGTYRDVPLKITLTPSDATRYQETEFGFSTNSATQKYTYVQPGKFYKLHPAALGSSGPVIGIGFPAFDEGTVKDE